MNAEFLRIVSILKTRRGEKACEWVESDSHGWICERRNAEAALTEDPFKLVVDDNEVDPVFQLNLLRNPSC